MPLYVSSSSSGGQKLYYTASGIITPNTIFDLLTMSTWCSNM